MNLIQKGFECDYEMNIFINIFFDRTEDGTIITDFCHENDLIKVKTEICFDGKMYASIYTFPFKNSESDPKIIKKIYSCACTKSFIRAAKKIRNIELPWGVMSGIRPAKSVRQFREQGKSEGEIREILASVYEVSDKKIDLAMKVTENEKIILERIKENSVSIYIGIPFCPSRCLYCSFVSTDVKNSGKYMEDFSDLLCEEIKKTGNLLKEYGFFVQNIYIGGGTPTTLSLENLEKIFKSIKKYINLDNLDEFTLEAGRPDTITYEKMELSKKYGVNRLSINPQTLHDETLERIGRKHSVEMFFDAFKIARDVGFDNINTDLIAGLPGETFADF
ncbi:MAG: radical SAM protein, partial [Clostridia bacterium]|nr:radical SAM protein [Clostridia bacterium]